MTTAFPAALDAYADPAGGVVQGSTTPTHSGHHANHNDAIEAIEAKLGTGAGAAVANRVLRGTGTGATAWGQIVAADITNDTITATQLAADCVGASELADSSVATANIIADAVTVRRSVTDGSGASTSSATVAQIPGMTTGSFSTSGGDLLVFATLTTYNGTVGAACTVVVDLDGAQTQLTLATTAGGNQNLNQGGVVLLAGVSAGTHTVKLLWNTTGGTVNRNGVSVLSVVEIKR